MTVSSTTSRADANGNGVTTAFTAMFRILDQTHITVLRTQISTGAVTTLALTTDYTVSGVGGASFTVTCLAAPTSDQRLSILRNVPFTQLADYVEGDPFPAASHEDALDKLTMEVQQLGEVQGRALTLAPNSTGISVELPEAEASALIGWNATADALVNYASATTTPVTAFAETLLDDTTAAEARTTLGIESAALAFADGSTATTQAAGDNSTKIATTAYADAATPAATTTTAGKAELATDAETLALTDTGRTVTPSNLGAVFGLVKLNSGTVSAAATLDILLTSYISRFTNFKIVVTDIAPATDVVAWHGRVSTNGGSSYDSGANNYGYIIIGTSTAATAYSSQGAATQMQFSPTAIGNLSTEGIRRFEADISSVNDTAGYCDFSYKTSFVDNTGAISVVSGTCMRAAAQDTDAFQFFFSSGNITAANWVLYGWN